jgi:hypothetical protein
MRIVPFVVPMLDSPPYESAAILAPFPRPRLYEAAFQSDPRPMLNRG